MTERKKSLFKRCTGALFLALCALLSLSAAALGAEEIAGYVLSTDIAAYIDGYPIPSYNVDGRLGVVAEDLRNYGFSVVWDAEALTLHVKRAEQPVYTPLETEKTDMEPGRVLTPVYKTNIVTYVDGRAVESFNIDGRTIIYFSALSGYAKGGYQYDDISRSSMFSTERPLRPAVTLSGDVFPDKILHAGGSIDGQAGSNSLEALEATYAAGRRFIEMDFLLSSDGHPVALHDWSRYYSYSLGSTPVSLDQFKTVKIYNRYTSVYLDSLAKWLSAHPDVYIITDVKDDNLGVLRKIAEEKPEILSRILPQIYAESEYAPVRALGYSNIIFTLYRLPTYAEKADAAGIVEMAERMELLALTFDCTLATPEYVETLKKSGVFLCAHTVNGAEAQAEYYALGVDCVYTDYTE